MNVIIPMAGAGLRFANEGYKTHKPAIPTIDRRNQKEYPMVVCATRDLPGVLEDGSNVIYIDRTFHRIDGVEEEIRKYYPKSKFLTVEALTEGQASTCLIAKDFINNDEPLLIAGCDNGMAMDTCAFDELTKQCDVIVFTYRNNPGVLAKPDAHGWVLTDDENIITDLSIKKAISDTPMNDHAIVATFWFKKGSIFVESAEKMIKENDRINGEFYVDQAIKHVMDLGHKACVFEIDKYIGWGTPKDYEAYMRTIKYWARFVDDPRFIPER